MGSSKGSQTTTSKAEPWKAAQPYIQESMQGAQDLYRSGQGFMPYPGSMVVPFSPQSQTALQGMESLAMQGNPAATAAQDWATGIMRGDNLAQTNPYFEGALNRQTGALTDDINRGFSMGGRYGSAAHTGALVDQVGGFRNDALNNYWNTERGLQANVAGMVPSIYQSQFQPMQMLGQVGSAYEGKTAQEIADAARLFEGYQQAPYKQLQFYNAMATGMGGLGGTQTSTQPGQGVNPLGIIGAIGSFF
jgi:hypothetical protein